MNILDILDRLKAYGQNLRRKWLWALLPTVVAMGLFYWHSTSRPAFYTATTVFHPEAERNAGGMESGLTQFFGLPGKEGGELAYMKGLLNSRSLNRSMVSDTVAFRGEKHLLADLIFRYKPPYVSLPSRIASWLSDPLSIDSLSLDKKVQVAAGVANNGMRVTTTENGFAQLSVSFYQSELTGIMCEQYLKKLQHYYAQQKAEKARQSLAFYSKRADSIKRELDKTSYALAQQLEKGRFNIRFQDEIYPAELESDQGVLSQMYVSLYLTQEKARAQLQRDRSVIHVIDPPLPPFAITRSSLLLYLVVGGVLGLGFGVFLVSYPLLKQDLGAALDRYVMQPAREQRENRDEGDGEPAASQQEAAPQSVEGAGHT